MRSQGSYIVGKSIFGVVGGGTVEGSLGVAVILDNHLVAQATRTGHNSRAATLQGNF